MRPLPLVLIIAATLAAAPSTALAKGIGNAEVCGAAGCQSLTEADASALMAEGNPSDPPSVAAPFFTLRMTMREDGPRPREHEIGFDYLPGLGLTHPHGAASGEEWVKVYPPSRQALDAAVRGIAARPASQLAGIAQPQEQRDGGPAWWPLTGAALAALALLALLARRLTKGAVRRRLRSA